jgi:hypothetical protein
MSFQVRAVFASCGGCRRPRQTRRYSRDLLLRLRHGEISLYAKNVSGNIPANVSKKIKEEIDAEG